MTFQSPTSSLQTSPLPRPDQRIFENPVFSDKRSASKIKPPSPPTKSPPFTRSRIYKTPMYQPLLPPSSQHTPFGNNNPVSTLTPGATTTSYFETMFEDCGVIGRGSFADVHRVRSRENGKQYAIKKMKRSYRSLKDRERAITEAKIGCNLPSHPHCIKYYTAWEDLGQLYIQTELCRGSLKDYIESHDIIAEEELWGFILDIALGLKHIHEHKLIHLDIKPGNLLFGDHGHLKIGDFGLTTCRTKEIDIEGDCQYVAPELLENSISYAADIFSFGATIFEIATNVEMPKYGPLWQQLREGNVSFTMAPQPPKRSAELEYLVQRMMHPDPNQRITLEQVLSTPTLIRLANQRQEMEVVEMEEDEFMDREISNENVISRPGSSKRHTKDELESMFANEDMNNFEDDSAQLLDLPVIAPVNLMTRFNEVTQDSDDDM